jgi:hypothetical protein
MQYRKSNMCYIEVPGEKLEEPGVCVIDVSSAKASVKCAFAVADSTRATRNAGCMLPPALPPFCSGRLAEDINGHNVARFDENKAPGLQTRTFLTSMMYISDKHDVEEVPDETPTFIWAQAPLESHRYIRSQDEQHEVRAMGERCIRVGGLLSGARMTYSCPYASFHEDRRLCLPCVSFPAAPQSPMKQCTAGWKGHSGTSEAIPSPCPLAWAARGYVPGKPLSTASGCSSAFVGRVVASGSPHVPFTRGV